MSEVRCETCRFWDGPGWVKGMLGMIGDNPDEETVRGYETAGRGNCHHTAQTSHETNKVYFCDQWRPGTRDDIAREARGEV